MVLTALVDERRSTPHGIISQGAAYSPVIFMTVYLAFNAEGFPLGKKSHLPTSHCPLMDGVSTGKYCTWFELTPNPCSPVANRDLAGYRRLEPELVRYP